jgi:hypothetical protein
VVVFIILCVANAVIHETCLPYWCVNQMIDNMISGQRPMGLEENQGKSDGIDTKENATG